MLNNIRQGLRLTVFHGSSSPTANFHSPSIGHGPVHELPNQRHGHLKRNQAFPLQKSH